jgi:hypothetical protein
MARPGNVAILCTGEMVSSRWLGCKVGACFSERSCFSVSSDERLLLWIAMLRQGLKWRALTLGGGLVVDGTDKRTFSRSKWPSFVSV